MVVILVRMIAVAVYWLSDCCYYFVGMASITSYVSVKKTITVMRVIAIDVDVVAAAEALTMTCVVVVPLKALNYRGVHALFRSFHCFSIAVCDYDAMISGTQTLN